MGAFAKIGLLILKIATIVLGVITAVLTGLFFSKPFKAQDSDCMKEEIKKLTSQRKPIAEDGGPNIDGGGGGYKDIGKKCPEKSHVVIQDLVVLAVIVLIIIVTIIVLVILLLGVCKNARCAKMTDMIFNFVAGVLIFLCGIVWAWSVYERSFKYQNPKTKEEYEEFVKDQRDNAERNEKIYKKYGKDNIVNYGYPKELADLAKKDNKDFKGDGFFVAIVVDGFLIFINAIIYIVIGVLIIFKGPVGGADNQQPQPSYSDAPPPPAPEPSIHQPSAEPQIQASKEPSTVA